MNAEEAAGLAAPLLKAGVRGNRIVVIHITDVETGRTFCLTNMTHDGAVKHYLDFLMSGTPDHSPTEVFSYKRFDV